MQVIIQPNVLEIASILLTFSLKSYKSTVKIDIKCIIKLPIKARLQAKLCIDRWNGRNNFNLKRGKLVIKLNYGG